MSQWTDELNSELTCIMTCWLRSLWISLFRTSGKYICNVTMMLVAIYGYVKFNWILMKKRAQLLLLLPFCLVQWNLIIRIICINMCSVLLFCSHKKSNQTIRDKEYDNSTFDMLNFAQFPVGNCYYWLYGWSEISKPTQIV